MANAEFWRDLSAQFCALPNDDGAFAIEWRVHAGEKEVRWKPFGTVDTWGQFEALAVRAGSALNPESGNCESWLSLLKDAIPTTSTLSVRRYKPDETILNVKEGRILHPCAASSLRCRVLEAQARGKKRGRIDTRTLFSADALKRIETAKRKADEFIWEAQAFIDRQWIDPVSRKAEVKEHEGRLESAKFLIEALRVEYSRLGLSDYEYQICINGEIDSIWHPLNLHYSEKRVLVSRASSQAEVEAEESTARESAHTNTEKPNGRALSPIQQLCKEAHLDNENLAKLMELDVRSVYRHFAEKAKPRKKVLYAYQKVLSERLGRLVKIDSMSFKRQQ